MDTSKIIKGVVNGRNYTVTAPIVKEDYGLVLQIEGVELPPTYQVDFSNSENNGTSVTMIGNSDGVLIPRQFIDSGKDVFAFLYHVGADYGRTVYKFRIPNKLRPDRTNEEPTPEEQSIIDQTISALNEAVEQAQDAQQAIEDMSVSATTLAEGSTATVTKTESEGVVHLEFGIPRGATGAQGERGEKGDKGDTGAQGIQGPKGDKGDTGAQGIQGPKGDRGEQGIQGLKGDKGDTGEKGDKGDKGDTGAQGIQGIQGEKGGQGIQGEKGEKGDKGDKGDKGEQGDDYVLTEQDKQDIAELVDAGGMVVNATLVSGTRYTIDSTYDDIKSALSQGKTVVVMTNGVPQPYVGNAQLDNQWFLAFGVSTIYNNVATLTGFMIPEAYQNIAVWTEQNTTIPQLNDVQIDGTSIVTDGVAEIPIASKNALGVISILNSSNNMIATGGNGDIAVGAAGSSVIKAGNNNITAITPTKQHESTFYGLAKAAGDTTQSASSNAVGQYTEDAKSAISEMLGGSVSVSGTTPTIVAKSGIRYVCGEVATLDFTPSASGICDVVFTSGATATVLNLPSTVKLPNWFSVEADTTYEINILDGVYGAVMSW